MEIYVHIPFCVKKCNYCDFLSAPAGADVIDAYVTSLIKEIRQRANLFEVREKITSVYFGGGTPSLLSRKQIEAVMTAIRDSFCIADDAEVTIEVNPKTVDGDKLSFLNQSGFNRLSIGMQSSHDDELKLLGRIHSYDDFLRTFSDARKSGFANINVDIMTALPGQDEKRLSATLEKVTSLSPEHISAYSLIIEPGTPFYSAYKDVEGPVVGEEMERKLYWNTVSYLKENGYEHYEISNFAKHGYEGKHNLGYWERVPYLGVGLGASSLLRINNNVISREYALEKRTRNETNLSKYIENPRSLIEEIKLEKKDAMEEFFFLGLREICGVNLNDFKDIFGMDARSEYGEVIHNLVSNSLLTDEGDRIFLTNRGIDYGNYVFSRFLKD